MRLTSRVAIALVVVTAGCGSRGDVPQIVSFTATPPLVAPGTTVTLSWSVHGAASLSIDPEIGAVTGNSIAVRPAATATYTLSARNAVGEAVATTSVTVHPLPHAASFTESSSSALCNGFPSLSVTLSWNVTDADTVSIAPGVGVVTGDHVTVTMSSTTKYTLTATSQVGTDAATITVAPPQSYSGMSCGLPGGGVGTCYSGGGIYFSCVPTGFVPSCSTVGPTAHACDAGSGLCSGYESCEHQPGVGLMPVCHPAQDTSTDGLRCSSSTGWVCQAGACVAVTP